MLFREPHTESSKLEETTWDPARKDAENALVQVLTGLRHGSAGRMM